MTPPPKTMGQTDNCAQAQYNHLTENTALLIACIQDNHANEHLQRSIHHPVDQIHLQVDPSPHVRCLNNKYDIQYATCQDVNNWVVVEKYNKHLECTHTNTLCGCGATAHHKIIDFQLQHYYRCDYYRADVCRALYKEKACCTTPIYSLFET